MQNKLARIEIPDLQTHVKGTRPAVVEVITDRTDIAAGSNVTIQVESIPGNKAVIYSYILPLLLFVATFGSLRHVTGNTGLAALLAIFTLIPYYAILWVITARSLGGVKFRLKNE